MNEFGENLQGKLNSLLNQTLPKGLTLEGWRFDLHTTNLLEVGIKNNKLGGPYTAPSLKTDTAGEIYLLWSGHKFTLAQINQSILEEFEANFELWQKTAYEDQWGAGLVEPYEPPLIPLAQEEAVTIVNGEFDWAFSLLEEGRRGLVDCDCRKVDGGVRIIYDQQLTANSAGLWIAYDQTPVEFYLQGDDLFSDYFAEKRLPTKEEHSRLINYTGETTKQLKKPTPFSTRSEMFVIFPPKVFEAFLEHFLLSNLSGNLIANRQSAFNIEDFTEKKQIFRTDFTVRVDGTRPYRYNSFRCTKEGVPSSQVELIQAGRLNTPLLDLKYARKLDLEPTPIPVGGGRGLLVSVPGIKTLEEVIQELDDGLIIYSLLGLHTQDYSSGKFSLKADQCLLVKNGEIRGKVEALIVGNFLEGLKADDSIFARATQEENPAFCMKVHVS